MKFFEDIELGEPIAVGEHLFTAEEIVRFASAFDPQPFHLSEEAAARGPFGRLAASGWHTAAIWMRLMVSEARRMSEQAIARGERPARLGPSPGFEDMQWRRPVFAGDRIIFSGRVTEKRELASRPQWGLVCARHEGRKEDGELAFAFTAKVFWERRSAV